MQISEDGKELQVFPPEALTFSPMAEEASASGSQNYQLLKILSSQIILLNLISQVRQ